MSDTNVVSVTGSPGQLRRAGLVLDLVDTEEEFVIKNLGPASSVRALPSNSQIATILGDIRIGTFTGPPITDEQPRGIINIQEGSVLAILPARHREQLLKLLARSSGTTASARSTAASSEHLEIHRVTDTSESGIDSEPVKPKTETSIQEIVPQKNNALQMPVKEYVKKESGPQGPDRTSTEPSIKDEKTFIADAGIQTVIAENSPPAEDNGSAGIPKTLRLILKPAKDTTDSTVTTVASGKVEFQNGEDILDLALPESLTLTQLLDLAGKHLDLNYIYSPKTVGNQIVALKMHGGLEGEMRIKDLYTLLETVLKFNGLAMIRREQKLVTIVPVGEALSADSQLIDVGTKPIQAGDTVLTRIFELQYVDAASVTNLLQNMKLGVAVSTLQETQTLFVTCYAHRIGRIEQLVNMLDKPGRARECRFRRLQYTVAPALAEKVRSLAQEI